MMTVSAWTVSPSRSAEKAAVTNRASTTPNLLRAPKPRLVSESESSVRSHHAVGKTRVIFDDGGRRQQAARCLPVNTRGFKLAPRADKAPSIRRNPNDDDNFFP